MLISEMFCWMWVDDTADGSGPQFSVAPGRYGNTILAMVRTRMVTQLSALDTFSLVSDTYAMGLTVAPTDWVFTPQEALQYDSKFDDGSPTSGTVMGEILDDHIGPLCVIEVSPDVYQYDQSNTSRTCGFFYRTGF